MNVSKRGFEVSNDSINDDRLILFSWPFDYHLQSTDMQDACPLIPAVVSHTLDYYVLNFKRLNSYANKNTLFELLVPEARSSEHQNLCTNQHDVTSQQTGIFFKTYIR